MQNNNGDDIEQLIPSYVLDDEVSELGKEDVEGSKDYSRQRSPSLMLEIRI